MGRIYRPVEIAFNGKSRVVVALIDTGADETVISKNTAQEIGVDLYGKYRAVCASQFTLEGKYADVKITELESGKSVLLKVGVSDVPFHTDDLDEEGLKVILGVDFLQEAKLSVGME